jgi:hypothetical protein
MVRPRAWVLNLDADAELEGSGSYTRSHAMTALIERRRPSARGLLGPSDVVVEELDDEQAASGRFIGCAFCPTPRSLEALRRRGIERPPAPSLAVLRSVNHRRFCAQLGILLPGAQYVDTIEECERAIARFSPTGLWLLKRPFGFAGRGRRRVARGRLDPSARAFVIASLRRGEGLQVEPWVERRGDFAWHGHLSRDGHLVLGDPTEQRCDEHGAWVATTCAAKGALSSNERALLASAVEETGHACRAAGYFGPFGVDAFRWVDERGRLNFHPRSEINARYSMGWATGMGARRPDLDG